MPYSILLNLAPIRPLTPIAIMLGQLLGLSCATVECTLMVLLLRSSLFFITERHCFSNLVEGLSTQCPCGKTSAPWVLESVVQKGHSIRALFYCRCCKQQRRTWSSSHVLAGHYIVNQKMVHAFTCAGMLPSQYTHLSMFSGIGVVGHAYIRRVYQKLGYIEIVGRAAEMSMRASMEEVQALLEYSTKGEWVVTDARHDSTANAYHSTVPCLFGSTHKIVGISTISQATHATAQTRELACTKVVLPQVIEVSMLLKLLMLI